MTTNYKSTLTFKFQLAKSFNLLTLAAIWPGYPNPHLFEFVLFVRREYEVSPFESLRVNRF
jgi:hypothetical protein